MKLIKTAFSDASTISLLVSNILVIILSLVQGWDVSEVLWVYWMQSVIIGFFRFLRILSLRNFSTENFSINNEAPHPASRDVVSSYSQRASAHSRVARILAYIHNPFSAVVLHSNNKKVLPTNGTRIFTAFFFLFHYGFFHLIYAILIFNFFKSSQTFDFTYIFLGGSIFFINHAFSFYYNRIVDRQKLQNIGQLMFSPYARIIPMHIVIVFGAILGQASLTIFLVLKTLTDLLMHIFKHRGNEYAK